MTQDGNPPSFIPSLGSSNGDDHHVASARAPRQNTQSTPPSFIPSSTGRIPPATGTQGRSSTRSMSNRQQLSYGDSPSEGESSQTSSPSSRHAVAEEPSSGRSGGRTSRGGTCSTSHGSLQSRGSAVASSGRSPHKGGGNKRKHRNIGKIVVAVLLALILALGISILGAWNWVNSRLDKTSWLTSMSSSTSSTSWLLLGSDERDGSAGGTSGDTPGSRTDTILVLTKPRSGSSSLISIPRDSLVQVSGTYMKINAVAEVVSRKALVSQIESITGHKIDHVAEIRFGGLQKVVDAIGGVKLCYNRTVNDADSELTWTAGCHQANGKTALAFSRMRYQDPNGDFGRAERQRQVISAIVSKATSRAVLTNPSTVKALATAGLDSMIVDEDSSPKTLLSMALAFRSSTGSKGITGSVYWTNPDYYVDGVGSSVLLNDAKNLKLFNSLANGTHKSGVVGTLAKS